MERGVQVRAAEKVFRFDEREFARGSILITPLDNRAFAGDLSDTAASASPSLYLACGIQIVQAIRVSRKKSAS